MKPKDRFRTLNHEHGHALDFKPRPSSMKAMKCAPCGNAIARAVCSICFKPLCRRHTIVDDGVNYCSDHKPGYE